jgi:hypothetical protein
VAEAVKPTEREPAVAATAPAASVRRRGFSGHLQMRSLRSLRPSRGLKVTRVGVAYFLLAASIAGAAAGLALALRGGGDSKPQERAASAWSNWHPTGLGSTASRQIANHVSRQYRLPSGKQLVNVIAHSPALASGLQTYAISAIEVEPDTSSEGARVFGVGNGVMYLLCGSASDCAIGEGRPTAARGALVRRQALELALYTFKYVAGVQTVLAFVPPPPGQQDPPKRFIVLQRPDVAAYLERPLAATIGRTRRVKPGEMSPRESSFVDRVTLPHLFQLNQTQQLPDGTLALLLTPEPLPPLS